MYKVHGYLHPCRSRYRICLQGKPGGFRYHDKNNRDGDAGGLAIAINTELTLNLSREEYLDAVTDQPKPLLIPLCAKLPLPDVSPMEIFQGLRHGCGFLLESMEGSEKIARYSFIGSDPELVVTLGSDPAVTGKPEFAAIAGEFPGANVIDQARSILSRFQYVNVKAPRFFGGMVGYIAYDSVYSLFDKVREAQNGSTGTNVPGSPENPDARFMFSTGCVVIDHKEKSLYIFSSPLLTYDSDLSAGYDRSAERIQAVAEKIAALEQKTASGQNLPDPRRGPMQYSPSVSRSEFMDSVSRVREHIAKGDIFQAVISRRIDCGTVSDPFAIYTALRQINPSPYMYYLDFGDEKVIGASPEMLVRVEKRRVTTVPIAGTRPRGMTPKEDGRLAGELLQDEKERAEHTMLVDLARNDLGRVCRFGSVAVENFMGIEKFSHVQHIVSTVTGTLKDNLDCYDALKSCFPAGTVSGAPKIRAMQIIGDEEPVSRGIYAGAVGYIGFDRNLEFAIAIRTVVVNGSRASVQVGAGIVADSVPENEWIETENKAAAMMRAIELAGAQ